MILLFPGRRGADSRLSSAQTALMLQEETIRRLERERKGLNEKISALDSSLAQAEADRRQLRDKVAQLQQSEGRSDQEKEAMRAQIENAESRLTKVELKKRSVEGGWSPLCTMCQAQYSVALGTVYNKHQTIRAMSKHRSRLTLEQAPVLFKS